MEKINYLFEQYSVLELFAYVLICGIAMGFVIGGIVAFVNTVRDLKNYREDDLLL